MQISSFCSINYQEKIMKTLRLNELYEASHDGLDTSWVLVIIQALYILWMFNLNVTELKLLHNCLPCH
jgi:hypothetical protein